MTQSRNSTPRYSNHLSDANVHVCDPRILSLRGRIELFSEWFDLTPPEIRYEEGQEERDGGILMTDEIFAWMRKEGAAFDWIISGDAKGICELMRMITLMSDKQDKAA